MCALIGQRLNKGFSSRLRFTDTSHFGRSLLPVTVSTAGGEIGLLGRVDGLPALQIRPPQTLAGSSRKLDGTHPPGKCIGASGEEHFLVLGPPPSYSSVIGSRNVRPVRERMGFWKCWDPGYFAWPSLSRYGLLSEREHFNPDELSAVVGGEYGECIVRTALGD